MPLPPNHIIIIGPSKALYQREVWAELTAQLTTQRLNYFVRRLAPGNRIEFTDNVQTADDAEPVIQFLESFGIPRSDIRLRYPSDTPSARLQSLLENGVGESTLDFGADVAERDDGLLRYFIQTPAFEAVYHHQKHIVVGPKGAGKSAILRELASLSPAALVITPEHYATDVLQALSKQSLASETAAYITTWKYTLLMEIFQKLVTDKIGDTKSLDTIRRYLINHGQVTGDLTLVERFLNYLRRITQVKGKFGFAEAEIGLGADLEELSKLFKMDELLDLIPVLKRALRRTTFNVFIDELDQSWNNAETANQFLVSLLTAAIQLRGLSPNLHVVVFLRSEIFDLLKPNLPQLDKLRSDTELIRWTERDLLTMIVTRALDSLQFDFNVPPTDALAAIFPGTIRSEGVGSFEYLVSRTSFRPREVIQFCNLALRSAQNSNMTGVFPDAVLRAEEEFSTWKLEHVVAENMYVHPRLDHLLERFRGVPRNISYGYLDDRIAEIILEEMHGGSAPEWLRDGWEPRDVIQLLYDVEVIGIENSSARRDSPLWKKYDFSFSRPRGKPDRSPTFLFHPGLWKSLELV